jgi:hypothetical protein
MGGKQYDYGPSNRHCLFGGRRTIPLPHHHVQVLLLRLLLELVQGDILEPRRHRHVIRRVLQNAIGDVGLLLWSWRRVLLRVRRRGSCAALRVQTVVTNAEDKCRLLGCSASRESF